MSKTKLKDHEAHIRNGFEKFQSYCGESIVNTFAFVDIDHAFNTVKNEGRIKPCPKCVRIITKTLKS